MHVRELASMDAFLARNGYCRKQVARDDEGSCIFRAVSEKLFLTQAYHNHVRQMCGEYMWRHQEEEWENKYAREWGMAGTVDMVALSWMYKLEFFIFRVVGMPPFNLTQTGYAMQICLVCVDGRHYDMAYKSSFVQELALCQSLVYDLLYRNVFGLSGELEEAVQFIRQQKKPREINAADGPQESSEQMIFIPKGVPKNLPVAERLSPPLPYRIAKALDPLVYRNVELDIIHEEKREIKHRLQARGLFSVFYPGDKCQVQLEDTSSTLYNAHIQEIGEPGAPVFVYIEELGEKKKVPYSSLRPLPLNASKTGSDGERVTNFGPSTFGDKRGRRRRNTMPGTAELQLHSKSTAPSPRSQSSRRQPETGHKTNVTGNTTHMLGDCIGVAEGIEMANYCVVATSIPMAVQPPLPALTNTQTIGQSPSGGVVYWMPVVTVPYANTMGHVNLAWSPSQDPYGKDLPLSDMNTLRYFFNLGVEYFHISANMQHQQLSYSSPSALPQLMSSGSPSASLMSAADMGQSFVHPLPPELHQVHSKASTHTLRTQTVTKSPVVPSPGNGGTRKEVGAQEGSSKCENMDLSSDMSDSGCASCGEGSPTGDDESEQPMEPNRTVGDDDDSSTLEEGENGSEKNGKGKGRRKYYMYGQHKLIKPIKDIPPRFQVMLAENSAAKARCEGQPIYMQIPSADMSPFEQADGTSELNADAQCFYPAQVYDTVTVDGNGQCTYSNTTMTFSPSNSQSHPLMVPPPPMMQHAGGPGPVSLVYSSASSGCIAQPSYSCPLPGSSSLQPNPGDGKSMPVVSTNAVASHLTGKGLANCIAEKHDEFARPSSVSKLTDSANSHSSSSSVLPVTSSSYSTCRPRPFPASASMLPPMAPPPIYARPAAPPGGGKQCFYLYPSPSTGFPPVPATPPQGQNHLPPHTQGQVVYVMNPQGFPAPPCNTFHPAMLAPSTHSMGMPCPTVTVQ